MTTGTTVFLLWIEDRLLGIYATVDDAKRAAEQEIPVGSLRWLELQDVKPGQRRMWFADHPAPINYRIIEGFVGERW